MLTSLCTTSWSREIGLHLFLSDLFHSLDWYETTYLFHSLDWYENTYCLVEINK